MSPDDTAPPSPARRAGRFALRYWVALILVALAAIFIAQNRERPRVHILWITVESPMWLLLTCHVCRGHPRGPSAASSPPDLSSTATGT